MTIAIGFVLRAVAGGLVIAVPISDWLLVCTILLALFLGLSKRRHELTLLADGRAGTSPNSGGVQPVSARSDDRRGHGGDAGRLHHLLREPRDARSSSAPDWLVLTTPFPIYGIFRYLYLVHRKRGRRESIGHAVDGSPAARLRGALGPRSHRHHLSTVRIVRGYMARSNSRAPQDVARDGPAGLPRADEPGRLSGRPRQGRRYRAQGQHLLAFLLSRARRPRRGSSTA